MATDVANHGAHLLVLRPFAVFRDESNVACHTADTKRSRYIGHLFRSRHAFGPPILRNKPDSLPDSLDVRIVFADVAAHGSRDGELAIFREGRFPTLRAPL